MNSCLGGPQLGFDGRGNQRNITSAYGQVCNQLIWCQAKMTPRLLDTAISQVHGGRDYTSGSDSEARRRRLVAFSGECLAAGYLGLGV